MEQVYDPFMKKIQLNLPILPAIEMLKSPAYKW